MVDQGVFVAAMGMSHRFKIGVMIGGLVCMAGCQDALFVRNAPRTPYERYQYLHGQRRATQENTYGRDQPALRQRLRPLSQ